MHHLYIFFTHLHSVIMKMLWMVLALLFVHQEPWQQELLRRYGNKMTLIDAIYKTTRYELALFFVTVKTNVGYNVVSEFILLSSQKQKTAFLKHLR